MKICPTCQQTYTDESLNFCLSDGSVLNQVNSDANSQPTVFFGQPPTTNPNPSPAQTSVNRTVPQFNQGISPQPSSAKKSKTGLWILGIVGGLIIIGGISFVGLIGLVAYNTPDPSPPPKVKETPNAKTPAKTAENVQNDDFSTWRTDSNDYGTSEYVNGEFIMSSKNTGYFYVLVSSEEDMKTSDAATKITVRNVNGVLTKTGYGLLIHSDKDKPLEVGYGFLIDAAKQSFRIVQHNSRKETVVKDWTRLPAIRSGTQTNELEVKDVSGKLSMYVNGQFAATITDSVKNSDGVFGLYAGDQIPIAFSNLVITK